MPKSQWRRSVGQAKAVAKQADELSNNAAVSLALSMEQAVLDLSANRPNPNDPSSGDPAEFAALMDEINSILATQEVAADRGQCWAKLRQTAQALKPSLQSANKLTHAQLLALGKELGTALADFQQCIVRPRPIKVA